MPARKRERDNRRVVHAAADILSPELVLVSPPEVAARARRLLPGPIRHFTPPEPSAAVLSRKSFAAFYTVCLAATLGPLLLAFLASH